MKIATITILCLLSLCSTAFALNYLQLDATPSVYDDGTDTVITTSSVFTLYALVDDEKIAKSYAGDDKFYISAALVTSSHEGVEKDDTAFYGSFNFNGTDYSFVDTTQTNPEYGTPPIVEYLEKNPDTVDLASHGIFDTYYYEFSFTIDPDDQANAYDVEYNAGEFSEADDSSDSKNLLYAAFDVDVGNLKPGYEIHFDLYTLNLDGSISQFAPWSHDAESGGDVPETPDTPVPEPATFFLLGLGLLGMAGMGRKKLI
ncbi:choice-of-anchor N protein [Desulfospira joergensenii]|uniref:choice-of-anchor N protein n=1 Tax=Desulfospira joergensenii TaxID=53329 RepID=UPI0004010113|nr:choice-of-anchor N protein [Desulfospira joergensenii]